MAVNQQLKDLNDFIELTSNEVIREAAYPKEEWIENGGNTGTGLLSVLNNYSDVSSMDDPPEITRQINTFKLLMDSNKPEPVKQDPGNRTANIASHWQKVQVHQYYKTLSSDDNFKKAFETFQKKKNSTTAPAGLKSEFADIRFYNLIALHIGVQKIYDPLGYKLTYPNAKLFKQARGHIEKLQVDIGDGIKLNSYSSQRQLETLLSQLILEIDQAPKKDYETTTAKYRRRLENFALSFMRAFGFVSATILTNLSAMLGWSCEHTTIDRIVKATKTKYGQQLAKALKDHTAQNSQK